MLKSRLLELSRCLALTAAAMISTSRAAGEEAYTMHPPGVVIDHSAAASGKYIGSPSLAILPDGPYLASHDFFGPKSGANKCATTVVFRSTDRGATWQNAAELHCLFWANLFVHGGAAYIMGTEKEYGRIVIRRSGDGGITWTEPVDTGAGLLAPEGHWHTAPMPVVEHGGRIWRAFENADGGTAWGKRFQAGVLSAMAGADLLIATNWTFSNFVPRNPEWLGGEFGGWLEGNAVVSPDGQIVDMLRVDTPGLPEKAAIVNISPDGRTASFDPVAGFVDFPGGAKKFSIRRDPEGGGYWSLASIVTNKDMLAGTDRPLKPGDIRNTLALVHSPDLKSWEIRSVILHHTDVVHHGFQYADWQFDGRDIAAVVRTASDDGLGGAHNKHDANFLTFNRISNFRELKPPAENKAR